MTPIQQMFLGIGGATKTYIDDVFSTYLYAGDGDNNRVITTNIDQSGEGCLTWIKSRTAGESHILVDTVRGASKIIYSDGSGAEQSNTDIVPAFTSAGFKPGSHSSVNGSGNNFAGWTFRNAPGFFDVVTWSGNATAGRQIPHNLGCVPGAIFTKRLNVSENWLCYHKGVGNEKYLHLNTDSVPGDAQYWYDTDPTSTYFTVNDAQQINGAGYNYVAYLFAGGGSTAATARSVDFDGTGDDLRWASNTDFAMGTGDFTWEAWIKPEHWNSNYHTVYCVGSGANTGGLWIGKVLGNFVVRAYSVADQLQTTEFPPIEQWTHVAATRSGTTLKLFYNGIEQKSVTNSYDFQGGDDIWIGNDAYDNRFTGKVSNLRLVKGTAVYTSAFKPPTEPLTNVTNTVLLCCNDSSVTGSTVTPGTITANGDPTASNTNPFDDPDSFVFGGENSLIKCGEYQGAASHSTPVEINVGFEPQWVIIKSLDSTKEWVMLDSMRKWTGDSGSNIAWLECSTGDAESTGTMAQLTQTGFICANSSFINGSNSTFIYMAIRRPDGYVAKPAAAGTDVFAMDTGNSSATIPNFASQFPVDFSLVKDPWSTSSWWSGSRKTQGYELKVNGTDAQVSWAYAVYDSNVGWQNYSGHTTTNQMSWMWKRGKSFDLITYSGDGSSSTRAIQHTLAAAPDMMWIKSRNTGGTEWKVYHSDLGPTTVPRLNNAAAAETSQTVFGSTDPTTTHFFVKGGSTNNSSETFKAILFKSISGISKVGSYTGSSSSQTITTGFQPRFIIFKNTTNTDNNWTTGWFTFDTFRGWASGNNDKRMRLNDTASESTEDWTNPTSTGFTINADAGNYLNNDGETYIYYAHA